MLLPSLLLSLAPSFPRCCPSRNETHPSGEQCCVCRQLMHKMRSLDEEEEEENTADDEPNPLRPGFAFDAAADDADVDGVDLEVLLLPPPAVPSSRSRYVSATARRYHSSVATISSKKARATTLFLLLLCSSVCWCCFLRDGEGGGADDEGNAAAAAAFSCSGCRFLQPPPAAALLASAEEAEALIGRSPPFPFIFAGVKEKERGRESKALLESRASAAKSERIKRGEQFFFRLVPFFLFTTLFFFFDDKLRVQVLMRQSSMYIFLGGRDDDV